MILTDTHSHLYAEEFSGDIAEAIERCKENNVQRIFLPNIDSTTIGVLKDLNSQFPDIMYPMMGLHPCSVQFDNYKEELETIKTELYNGKYFAVGETGLDLYWDKSTLEIQIESLRQHVEWSLELDLPIVLHARESTQEIIDVLSDYSNELKGVFHCFSGNAEQAQTIIDRGMYLGLGGVLTFKNSGLKDIVKDIGLKHILLETDSPYLAPVPYRGKRNESSYLLNIAQFLADLKGENLEKVAEITTNNSRLLFGV
jgi:TatD DNase family protein